LDVIFFVDWLFIGAMFAWETDFNYPTFWISFILTIVNYCVDNPISHMPKLFCQSESSDSQTRGKHNVKTQHEKKRGRQNVNGQT
jgi:hypothetical protein